MSKAKDLLTTKQRRGVVRTSVTLLEYGLVALEAKDTLTSSDLLFPECLLKKIEALDAEFKEHHYAMINLIEDDEHRLGEEQVVMDYHEDKVTQITQCLQQLWPESKAAPSAVHFTGHSHHLRRRLNHMEPAFGQGKNQPLDSQSRPRQLTLTTITGAGWLYKVRPFGHIPRYSVVRNGNRRFIGTERWFCDTLFDLSLQIKRLLHNRPSNP